MTSRTTLALLLLLWASAYTVGSTATNSTASSETTASELAGGEEAALEDQAADATPQPGRYSLREECAILRELAFRTRHYQELKRQFARMEEDYDEYPSGEDWEDRDHGKTAAPTTPDYGIQFLVPKKCDGIY